MSTFSLRPVTPAVPEVTQNSISRAIVLPRAIRPSDGTEISVGTPFRSIPGTPRAVVRVCREAIQSAAVRLGAVRVDARSAGSMFRHSAGTSTAPLVVRIQYDMGGIVETRQARVRCQLDARGSVYAVK